MTKITDERHRGRIEHAIAGPDEKLSMEDAPIVEYLGFAVMPQTDGKPYLCFSNDDVGSIGFRMEKEDLREMIRQLEPEVKRLAE